MRDAAALLAPNAPTNLVAGVNGSTVTLTWTAAQIGEIPTSYVVEAGSTSAATDLVSSDTGSVAPTLIAANVPAGTYYVRVRARNGAGRSAPSNEVVVSVGPSCTPSAPSDLSISTALEDPGVARVTMAWKASGGSCVPAFYEIDIGWTTGAINQVYETIGPQTTFSAGWGRVLFGLWYVRVRAVNGINKSGTSNEIALTVGITSNCTAAPSQPTNLQATAIGTTVRLFWNGSAGVGGGGLPTSYVVEAGSAPGRTDLVPGLVMGSGSTTLVSSNVAPGIYYVRVRAKNDCGTSPPSNEASVTVAHP
jgi:hypothetical protein